MHPYELKYDFCSILICVLILAVYFTKKNTHKIQNILFLLIVINGVVSGITDVISSFMISHPDRYPCWIMDIFNLSYLSIHNFLSPLFSFYIICATNVNKKYDRTFYYAFSMPFLLSFLCIISNPFFHGVYYYNSDNVYTHGFLIYVLYIVSVFYILMDIYYLVRYRASVPNRQHKSFLFFMILTLIVVLFQLFYPKILIELFAQSLVYLSLIFTVEDDGDLINPVTKIFNRKSFIAENNSSLEANIPYYLLLVKIINKDSYSNVIGFSFLQNALKQIADFLVSITSLRNVYDCDNGNFVIIFYKKEHSLIPITTMNILERFEKEWGNDELSISFEATVTQVEVPVDINNIKSIMELVDINYSRDKNGNALVQKDYLKILQRQTSVEKAIEKAINNKTLQVYFQPIWDCNKNKIICAEALVRLYDDVLGFIPPDEFIPIAEQNGLVSKIGEFVFEYTCEFFKEKDLKKIGIEFIDVNLSTVQCMQKNIAKRFKIILDRYGLSPECINLEITESAAINSPETFLQCMQEFRSAGFCFSLDDYGTGYSNASYIFNMDFSIIKIDKSILWGAEKNKNAKIILINTIKMIKEMGLKIIVEGVETEEQKNLVKDLGCDLCQGFYFSRPVNRIDFIEYCKKFNGIQ